MEKLYITLKRAAIKADLVIRSIPLRLQYVIKNKLILTSHITNLYLRKYPKNIAHSIGFNSYIGQTYKALSEKIAHTFSLECGFGFLSEKMSGAHRAGTTLDSELSSCYSARYRILNEMDTEGAAEIIIGEFDNMMLEEIDFVILQ